MTRQQDWLNAKNPKDVWAEDPNYSWTEWRSEVVQNNTRRGYWSWVAAQYEERD